jgi:hypothetical protein
MRPKIGAMDLSGFNSWGLKTVPKLGLPRFGIRTRAGKLGQNPSPEHTPKSGQRLNARR